MMTTTTTTTILKFHKPFSPTIMETEAPKEFVDKINSTADKVLGSEAASVEWDWSHNHHA